MVGLKEEECRTPVGVEVEQTEVLAGKLRQTWKVTHYLQTDDESQSASDDQRAASESHSHAHTQAQISDINTHTHLSS